MIGLTGTTTGYGANAAELAKLGIRLGNSAVPTNGLYSTGAGQLAISTAGTGRLFVDSLGRVGIGTASPARILDIVGTSALTFRVKNTDSTSATQAQFHNDSDNGPTIISYCSAYAAASILNVGANGTAINVTQGLGINAGSTYQIRFGIGNTERMRIDSSGRLLVGTSASRSSAFGAPLFQVENTSGLASVTRNAVDGFGSAFILGKSRGTSYETLVANDNIGIYSFHGANGSAMVEAARIQCDVDGTVSGGGVADMPGRLVFSTTADGAGTSTERMRIDSSGRVGIGTTSPEAPVHVSKGSAGETLRLAGDSANVRHLSFTSSDAGIFTGAQWDRNINSSGGIHTWSINATERARIDSSGRLLVGTSSDAGGALLQVNGDRIRVGTAKTPASATATGTAGEICWDANYIYVCTAANTWKRTAIATW